MPSFPRNVLLPLYILLAVLLYFTASAQDEEARQKQLKVLSLEQTPAMTPPPAPNNLHVDSYTSTTVTLKWEEPDTLCDIVSYTVKYKKDDGLETQYTHVSETTFTVTDMLPNSTFTFEVYAATSYGEGPAATVQQITAADEGGPPENLVAEGVSPSVINVSWSEPYTKPLYYLLQAPPCMYSEDIVYGLQYQITGLDPCQRCFITVTSYYSYSNKYPAEAEASSLGGAPPPPRGCSIDVQQSSIRVDWESPTTDCVLGEYSVYWTYKKLSGDGEEGSGRAYVIGTTYILYNPVPYCNYTFEISASVDGVFGSPTICSVASLESRGSQVAPEQPQDLQVFPDGFSSIMVLWGRSPGADHYHVFVEGEDMEDDTTDMYYLWENLEACTNYTFGVTAVSAEGDMSEPALADGETEDGPPPAPNNLQVDSYMSTTVTLKWEEPDTLCDIVSYTVKYRKDDGLEGQDTQVSETTFTVTDLLANTNYTFEVSAATSYGEGPAATVQQTTAVDDGGPPNDLVAEGVSPSDINVSWSEPYAKPLYYLVQAPPCMYSEDIVYDLQYQITGLDPCQHCFITVTSYYSDGSKYPAQADASSLGGAPPPPSCGSFDVLQGSIRVNWERPNIGCVLGVYSVEWTWKKLWGDGEEGSGGANTTGTTYILYNPVPYSSYSFEISASIDGVFGSPTSCSTTSLESPPGPPVLLSVDPVQGGALVTWDTPAEENGVIVNYGIFVDEETEARKTVDADIHNTNINDQMACTNVSISVKAYNGAGWGDRSEAKDVTVADDVLPDKLNCAAHDRAVEVCWEPYSPTCPVSQYNLRWEGDVLWSGDGTDSSTTLEWSDTVICYIISAIPYTEYRVELSVGTKTQTIECSDTTPMAAPGPPTLEEVQADNLVINVTWKEPVEKNGIIDCYQVKWNDSGVVNSKKTDDNSTFSYQILGLSCGDTVTVTVSAKTTDVTEFGENSSPRSVNLTNSVSTLNCSSTTPGQISLTWTLEDSECAVGFYNITWTYQSLWSDETGAGWKLMDGKEISASVTQLPPYAIVSVELYVDNAEEHVGCSVTTLEEHSSAPTQLKQVANDTTSVTIEWSLPEFARGELSKWQLNWSALNGDNSGGETINDPSVMEREINNLLSAKTYVVYVMAVNGAGIGEPGAVNASTRISYQSNDSNLGLILGLSIGGGVLLIVLLIGGFILYRKKKTTKPPRSAPYMSDTDNPDSTEMYKNQQLSSASQRFQDRMGSVDYGTNSELYTSPRPSLPKDESAADDVDEGLDDGQQVSPGDKGIMFGVPADRRFSQQMSNNLPRLGEMNRRPSQQVNIRMKNFEEYNRLPSQQHLPTTSDSGVHSRPHSEVGRPNLKEYGRRPSQQIPMPNLSAYGRRPSQQIDLHGYNLNEHERRSSVQINSRRPSEPRNDRRSSLQGNIGSPRSFEDQRRFSQQIPAYRPSSESRRPSQPAIANKQPGYDYRRRPSQQADIGRPVDRAYMRRPSQQFIPKFQGIQEL